jgi:hypothetical protein
MIQGKKMGADKRNVLGGSKQHCYHHAPKVKPVVELLMMDVRTPETC